MFFFFSSRRRHTRYWRDWSSDVCSSDLSMMVTTRRMQGLFIDPERRTARVEAGVKWQRVMEAAAEFGLAGLCGSSSDVGVVGYTLRRGVGPAGRQHGFAPAALRLVGVVTR